MTEGREEKQWLLENGFPDSILRSDGNVVLMRVSGAMQMYSNQLRDQLSKEREMRKELVEGLRLLTSMLTPDVESNIEVGAWNNAKDLIAKATELDKK